MITVGNKVAMNDNYYVSEKNRGVIFTVRSKPFDVCGTVCVMLENYKGCYALDGLREVWK